MKLFLEHASQFSFIVKEWDGNEPQDCILDLFDVEVTYAVEDMGHTDHPYGEGWAREEHGIDLWIVSLVADQDVVCRDVETDAVIRTIPKGTKLQDIPGWDERNLKYFENKAGEQKAWR